MIYLISTNPLSEIYDYLFSFFIFVSYVSFMFLVNLDSVDLSLSSVDFYSSCKSFTCFFFIVFMYSSLDSRALWSFCFYFRRVSMASLKSSCSDLSFSYLSL